MSFLSYQHLQLNYYWFQPGSAPLTVLAVGGGAADIYAPHTGGSAGDFSQGNHGNSGTFGREPSTANLYLHQAHLSNFRIVKGKTVYTANFTPPQSELTVIDGTILLAFQDSTDPTKDKQCVASTS